MAKWQVSFEITKSQPKKCTQAQDEQVQDEIRQAELELMQRVITNGILLARKYELEGDLSRAVQETEQKEKDFEETQRILGIKDFDNWPKVLQPFCRIINSTFALIRMLWIPESKIKNCNCLSALIKAIIACILSVAQIILVVISLFIVNQHFPNLFFWLKPASALLTNSIWQEIIAPIYYIWIACACLAFAGLLRAAKIEMSNINNKSELYGLFAALIAVVALFA